MIRFICRRDEVIGGHLVTEHFTVDAEVPELQRLLGDGGVDYGDGRFDVRTLIGAEIVASPIPPAPAPSEEEKSNG